MFLKRVVWIVVVTFLWSLISSKSAKKKTVKIDEKCFLCLCLTESYCRPLDCPGNSTLPCGYYKVTKNEWDYCKLGKNWRSCSKSKKCSEACITKYVNKYIYKCTDGREPKCRDISRLHTKGLDACHNDTNIDDSYWDAMSACLLNIKQLNHVKLEFLTHTHSNHRHI